MPTKVKHHTRVPTLYGNSSRVYNWNNDPFSDPIEKLNAKNAKGKKKYPLKKKRSL